MSMKRSPIKKIP